MKPKGKQFNKSRNNHPDKIVYTGNKPDLPLTIHLVKYNETDQQDIQIDNLKNAATYIDDNYINWFQIRGFGDVAKLTNIGQAFQLHPLVLKDLADTEQPPKLEEYENYLFILLKYVYFENDDYQTDHIGIVIGSSYVITFTESEKDIFSPINSRIDRSIGQIHKEGSDYLGYSIIDAVVDQYYTIIQVIGDYTEGLEDKLIYNNIQQEPIREIQELKHDFIRLRRIIHPTKEIAAQLLRTDHYLIKSKTKKYIADLFDHIVHIADDLEVYREISWNLMEIYIATINNKMNEIIKVLTIMTSIFIPLTFIAGIYGMNFDNMPELRWQYGYFYTLGVMLLIFILMLLIFKKKKWI